MQQHHPHLDLRLDRLLPTPRLGPVIHSPQCHWLLKVEKYNLLFESLEI